LGALLLDQLGAGVPEEDRRRGADYGVLSCASGRRGQEVDTAMGRKFGSYGYS
jgi:hypothetical protein